MPSGKITREDIGSARYHEALRREAGYWERVTEGQVDISVASWSRPEVRDAVNGDIHRAMLDAVAARGKRVLDLGCGGGWYTFELAGRGCVVDGVDISTGRISLAMREAKAQARTGEAGGAAHFFIGDLNRLSIGPNEYDVVLAAAVLHHVLDIDSLLDQVHRALKPGGTLVCVDHRESTLAGRAIRYGLLLLLPTEVPYWRKPLHAFNRVMARVYRRVRPGSQAPARFDLPERSPFEDVTGAEAVEQIRRRFRVEEQRSYLAFADVVAGHIRAGSVRRDASIARVLRRLDDWLVRHAGLRGDSYYLVARKPGF